MFFNKEQVWYRLTDAPDALPWQANQMCLVEVNGKTLTLARYNNAYYAFAHKCPHASGIMADGFLDAQGQVVCPLHRYRFNIQNGRNTSGEGYYLKTYPLESRADGLYILL
ncbi:MAG: Rieske 2Fe-2S domain-containing protein [Chitinophagaceae bacterium]|jgi:3-phenylpropionate/trans-cinnamate dioxygenase ferredoxin subunit|nr:Rieske 2Fe-2S domain-containing protein [Chitinophagaceae bacterium]